MIAFKAKIVSACEEPHGCKVIWREGIDSEDEKYLMLQRMKNPSLADRLFGFSKVYIEVCGQGWSWYGNIKRFELSDSTVRVELSRHAAKEMSDDGIVEITYLIEQEKKAEWGKIIHRIFGGCKVFEGKIHLNRK